MEVSPALEIAQELAIKYSLKYPTRVNIEAIANKILTRMDKDTCFDILDDLLEVIYSFE